MKNGHALCFVSGQQPIYEKRYPTQKHPNAKYLGNTKTGENVYTFTYCNARSSSIKKLEKNRLALVESIKEKQKSRNPESRPITPLTSLDQHAMEEVMEDKELQKRMLENVPKVGIDEDSMKQTNGTAGTVVRGQRKEQSYTAPGKTVMASMRKSASASSTPKGGVVAAKNNVNDAIGDLMDGFMQDENGTN